jgi:hypothetical protein
MGKMLDMLECDEADMYPELSCGRRAGKRRQRVIRAPQAFYDVRESPLSVLPAIRAALIAAIDLTVFETWERSQPISLAKISPQRIVNP